MNKTVRFSLKFRSRMAILMLSLLFASSIVLARAAVTAADNIQMAQGIVDWARLSLENFMNDPNYVWFRQNLDRAKGILIFPQVFKGGSVFGASGGTGILVVRDEKTGSWSEPAFYTVGPVAFEPQIKGRVAEAIVMVMTQKAIDSLLSSSFKLGGDTSIALGPVGVGAKADRDLPSVSADFVSFAKSKGLHAALNLEGAVVAVRDNLNEAYYHKYVAPVDIIARQDVTNPEMALLSESLKCKC